MNCSNSSAPQLNTSDPTHHVVLPPVSEVFLQSCDPLLTKLNDSFKGVTKYKYETLGDDNVAFHMIRDNASAVLQKLDAVRGKRKKFVCLNDNIDHSKKDAELIKALLVDFYQSLFPIPSQFELPLEYRNKFLHISDLNEWKREREEVRFWTNILVAILILAVILTFFPGPLIYLIQLLCPLRRRFSFFQRSSSSTNSRLMTVQEHYSYNYRSIINQSKYQIILTSKFVANYKTVLISAYSSTCEQSNNRSGMRLKTESETGERY